MKLPIFLIDFLPILIPLTFISLVIGYEDTKRGIIKNKYIAVLILGGFLYQTLTGNIFLNLSVLSLFTYGLAIGFLLWFLGIWPAGDAKLFASYLLYFPPEFYSQSLILDYLVNIFVPIFLCMVALVLFRSKSDLIKEGLAYSFNPYRIFTLVVIMLGFVAFIMKLVNIIGFRPTYFLSLIILFLAFELFQIFLSFATELAFTLIAVLRIIFDFETVFSLQYAVDFFSLIVLFIFLRFFFLYLTYYNYSKKVPIEDLETGMSPSEGIVKTNSHYGKIKFLNVSLINYMQQKKENFIHSVGFLKEEDIERIKNLKREGKLSFDLLRIGQKQHFAIILFLGYLLTLFLGSDFVYQLKLLI